MSNIAEKARFRFVKALIAGGEGRLRAGGGAEVKRSGHTVRLPAAGLHDLRSQGIVTASGGRCAVTAEARSWLRRQLSAPGDFAAAHRDVETSVEGLKRNLGASPLLKLGPGSKGERFLAHHQIAAAERVCAWGEKARLGRRVTMAYSPHAISGGNARAGEVGDMAMDARRSLARLYEQLPRECAETIMDVCVFDKGLQTIETERGWPRRSAKLVLRIGLEQLAQKMGLAPSANGPASVRSKVWHGPDALPTRFE